MHPALLAKVGRLFKIAWNKVGETVFHVCFLMGTPIHMHLAKRMLKHFPLLLNDIYLSEEYYGENVLHMAAVAEVLKHHVMTCHEMSWHVMKWRSKSLVLIVTGQDPSIVKWLLDIGADFHRRCYGDIIFSVKFMKWLFNFVKFKNGTVYMIHRQKWLSNFVKFKNGTVYMIHRQLLHMWWPKELAKW